MRLDGGARGAADGVTKARHAALMEVGIEMEVCSGDDGSAADGAGRETNGPSRRKTARSIQYPDSLMDKVGHFVVSVP